MPSSQIKFYECQIILFHLKIIEMIREFDCLRHSVGRKRELLSWWRHWNGKCPQSSFDKCFLHLVRKHAHIRYIAKSLFKNLRNRFSCNFLFSGGFKALNKFKNQPFPTYDYKPVYNNWFGSAYQTCINGDKIERILCLIWSVMNKISQLAFLVVSPKWEFH